MTEEITMNKLERSAQAEFNERVLRLQMKQCDVDPDSGVLVRGRVKAIVCPRCKNTRWDDGAPCKHVIDHADGRGPKPCSYRLKIADRFPGHVDDEAFI